MRESSFTLPRVSPVLDIISYPSWFPSFVLSCWCATALGLVLWAVPLWTVPDAQLHGTNSPVFEIFLLKERLCTTLGETQVRPQSFLVQLDDNTELNQEWLERKEHLGQRCLETQKKRAGTAR